MAEVEHAAVRDCHHGAVPAGLEITYPSMEYRIAGEFLIRALEVGCPCYINVIVASPSAARVGGVYEIVISSMLEYALSLHADSLVVFKE